MLYNIPIESLEERYSKQWNRWFPKEFKTQEIDYMTLYSETLCDTIETGEFLDAVSTNYFKAGQLKIICNLLHLGRVKDGDVFFFHDLWFPGLEMLFYMRDALGIDFKICGILHAGCYDPHDYLSRKGMGNWGESIELGWLKGVDAVFVATRFHKDLILETHAEVSPDKIQVTGLPIYQDWDATSEDKENIVVFPHRCAPEKQPEMFDQMALELSEEFPDWRFVKTKDACKTKDEYYNLLGKAKIAVSCALQETWGIAQQEALFLGCIPVVPNVLSYREMYNQIFRYTSENLTSLVFAVRFAINRYELLLRATSFTEDIHRLSEAGESAIQNITDGINKLKQEETGC